MRNGIRGAGKWTMERENGRALQIMMTTFIERALTTCHTEIQQCLGSAVFIVKKVAQVQRAHARPPCAQQGAYQKFGRVLDDVFEDLSGAPILKEWGGNIPRPRSPHPRRSLSLSCIHCSPV